MDADVVGLLIADDGEVGVRLQLRAEQRFDFLEHPLVAPVGHEKLEPRVVALQPVAVVAVDFADAFDDGPHLRGLEEDLQDLPHLRRGAEPAADLDAEAALLDAIDLALQSEEADAIDVGLRAMDAAAGDADFVFAREVGKVAVVFERGIDLLKLRGRVEDFIRVEPGDGAADDVPRDVAAGAAGAETDALEFGKNRRDFFDAQPVVLDGHARGDVAEAVAEAVAQLRDLERLRGGELAAGDAEAHHEVATFLGLLPIDAVPFHPIEVVRIDRSEARFRVAIDVVDDIEPVLIELHLFLRSDGDEALLDGGVVRLDVDHGLGKKGT